MIVKESFYNIECDCCHTLRDEDQWHLELEDFDYYGNDGWLDMTYKQYKHYCPKCWSYDDDGNIITKDGKVYDGETYKLIKE